MLPDEDATKVGITALEAYNEAEETLEKEKYLELYKQAVLAVKQGWTQEKFTITILTAEGVYDLTPAQVTSLQSKADHAFQSAKQDKELADAVEKEKEQGEKTKEQIAEAERLEKLRQE